MSQRTITVTRLDREAVHQFLNPSFTRALSPEDVAELALCPVKDHGAISIQVALASREAVIDEVIEDSVTGSFVATAVRPRGHNLIAMGSSPLDAAQRLATLAVRP